RIALRSPAAVLRVNEWRAKKVASFYGAQARVPALLGWGGGGGGGKLPTETAFDAEIAVGDAVVEGGGYAENFGVFVVDGEIAADAAVGANSIGLGLLGFVPGAGFAHFEFGFEHERAGGADADAISAIDAGGIGQRDFEFGGDVGGEAAPGNSDSE